MKNCGWSSCPYDSSRRLFFLLAVSECLDASFLCASCESLHIKVTCSSYFIILLLFIFPLNLTYSRWTSSLPSCLWSQRIFPSLPGSRLTIFYRDASSALLQLVNQWLNFTYSRSHAFRYERKNPNPTLVRIELTTSRCAAYLLDHLHHFSRMLYIEDWGVLLYDIHVDCRGTSGIIQLRIYRRYFQHAHFIPIVGVRKRGAY